jgi:hypothetical protein
MLRVTSASTFATRAAVVERPSHPARRELLLQADQAADDREALGKRGLAAARSRGRPIPKYGLR